MRRAIVAFACAATLAVGAHANAHSASRIVARVHCAHVAEDTLAHVRMVRFARADDGTVRVVYRCERTGY